VASSLTESSVASLPPPPPPPAPIPVQSVHETFFHESIREERRFKKGKTRMPKRLVRREAIMDLGYPFEEEDDFFVLTIALEKEQIDEVIQISEQYKDGGRYLK
jgi:chlorite dismutase